MSTAFIQQQNDIREDYKIGKKLSPIVIVWQRRPTKGVLFLFLFAIIVPVLIYYFVIDKGSYPAQRQDTCSLEKSYRIQCGKSNNVTYKYCSNIGCCFDNSTQLCYHYLPSKYYYYQGRGDDNIYHKSRNKSPFEREQSDNISLSIVELDEDSVQIVLHNFDPNFVSGTKYANKSYYYEINATLLSVEVYRNDHTLLLTTAKGPLIISDNYWEWSFQLTDEYLFGLGQTLIDLDENSTLTKVVYGNAKDHNTLPVFLANKNGQYHGLLVKHTGPLEVTVLPSKLVSLKSLTGDKITLELTVGPSIRDVITQQNKHKTKQIDFQGLGVHVCREGSLTDLTDIMADYQNAKDLENAAGTAAFRYDFDCIHENLILAMRNEDNSTVIESVITNITDSIIAAGRRFVLSLPPQIPIDSTFYNDTIDLDVYFKYNLSATYQGQYSGIDVVYPYFNHSNITDFVQQLIGDARATLDSVWPNDFLFGQNWPSDEYQMNEADTFQYLSPALIDAMSFTLPWDIVSGNKDQFLDHNEYGYFQVQQIKSVLKESNASIMTMMTASHTFDTEEEIIIQNVDISWTNFQKSIVTILSNSILGFPLTSIPVCGSTSNFNASQESLCIRWYLMASMAPVFRISSDLPMRDPISLATLTSEYAANQARRAIDFRYSLQYYLYNFLASGEPLMRPMFYDFPDDNNTFGLIEQYMVGSDLLVVQPTLPDQTQLKIYLPNDIKNWFEFEGGDVYSYNASDNGWITLDIVETDLVRFIREGAVIPLVEENSDGETVTHLVHLKVALKCNSSVNCTAVGGLTDGNSTFTFTFTYNEMRIEGNGDKSFIMNQIDIYTENEKFEINSNFTLIQTTCSYTLTNETIIC